MSEEDTIAGTDSKPPVFQNRNESVTVWADEDKNGNMFLRVNLPMNLGSVPVFVNDSGYQAVRDEFNDFVGNLKKAQE